MAVHGTVIPVLEGALYAGVYAIIWYARRRQEGEAFKPYKFGVTVAAGAVIGGGLVLAGDPLAQATIEAKLVAYAGLLTVLTPLARMLLEPIVSRLNAS